MSGLLAGRRVKVQDHWDELGDWLTVEVAVAHGIEGLVVQPRGGANERVTERMRQSGVAERLEGRLDEKFVARGAGQLLGEEEVERTLDQLFGKLGFLRLSLEEGWLRANKRLLRRAPEARELREALALLARLAPLCERRELRLGKLGPSFAIAGSGESLLCPYCRDDLAPDGPDLATCPRCRTLHHSACMSEAGGCTVFGCGEGRRARARA